MLASLWAFSSYDMKTPYSKKDIEINGLQISYEFLDKASSEKELKITHFITRTYDSYADLFGGLPRNLYSTEYKDFSVWVKHLGGEADPKVIIFTWSFERSFGYNNWKTLLMHEIFHLWSAESIRYVDGREHWFNEGSAEYYTLRAAAQLDLISSEEALSIAAHPIGYYSSSKGLENILMREAGKTNKTEFDNYFLVYNGGWIVAIVMDYKIRSMSKGKNSLNDLMKWMYKNFKRHEKLYSL